MSAAEAAIQKKMYRSDCPSDLAMHTTALIISNEEMEDIMKIVKSLQELELLIKGVCEKIKSEAKKQKCRFLPMLLGILAASILGNALAGKGVIRTDEGVIRARPNF